jgi:hypothetical protein
VTVRVSPRLAAIGFVVVGLWFAVLVPPHPDIVRHDVARGVLESGTWRLTHAWMFLAGIAAIVAAAGVVGLHGERFGRAGDIALGVMLVSAVATAAAGLLEATVFPFLARAQPDAIAIDGPIFTAPLFRALSGPWLLFPLAFSALGWLTWRAGDYRVAGAALGVTGGGFFALGMWFVPFAGVASSVALGAALGWWGVILWSAPRAPA